MRLYFVECSDKELNKYKREGMTIVDRGSGYTSNKIAVSALANHAVGTVLSNDETLLHNEAFWSNSLNEWEIYLYKGHDWKNINLITDKIIKYTNNVTDLYINGEFNN